MCRPQASQLAAGRRTDVPVSSQGMQWKRRLKAKCREQVPNLPLPRARGTWHVEGQAGHHPGGLPNHSRFPARVATRPSLALTLPTRFSSYSSPGWMQAQLLRRPRTSEQSPARCSRGGRRALFIFAHSFPCSGPWSQLLGVRGHSPCCINASSANH